MTVLLVALAGGVGAMARWVTDQAVQRRPFPWGILLVNLAGSLLLGALTGLWLHHGLRHSIYLTAGAGFCGGFTTFSTFVFDTVQLTAAGKWRPAMANAAGTLLGCTAIAGLGLALTFR